MPSKHNPGCQCCSCQDKPLFTDDFSEVKADWHFDNNVFITTGGVLTTNGGSGSYYRSVSIASTANLRIVVNCSVFDSSPVGPNGTIAGIFVGGLGVLYWEKVGVSFRLKFGIKPDSLGNSPVTVIDLGAAGVAHNVQLIVESDWTNTGHYFVVAQGGSGAAYAAEVDVSLGSAINIGVLGSGRWDDFSIVRNQNAVCSACGYDNREDTPKSFLLSVPAIGNGDCDCGQLSGNFTLTYKRFANYNSCQFVVSCAWVTEGLTGRCGNGSDVCPDGYLWVFQNGTLSATGGRNILKYCAATGWQNNDVITLTECCLVCAGACVGVPATLTLVAS